ncbi:MAG: dTDP-4-dehydrorhamnose 3,5-epimerase [Longimicrobiales bacterium]
MTVVEAPLAGVRTIALERFDDERGWFAELWNAERYGPAGLPARLVQSNASFSRRGTLRGMHFQFPEEQGKLVSVLSGAIFDAVVDIRVGSPTFGHWYGCELSVANRTQLWAPPGVAHGFLVLSETAVVQYGCTASYAPQSENTIAWDDPDVAIGWPAAPHLVSDRDAQAPRLAAMARERLPIFTA